MTTTIATTIAILLCLIGGCILYLAGRLAERRSQARIARIRRAWLTATHIIPPPRTIERG
jgi:membrane protein DedA with SNARE-associated domain